MSTKIYNTFRMKGSSLDDTLSKIYSIKKQLKENILQQNSIKIFNEITYEYYRILYNIVVGVNELTDEDDKKDISAFSKVIKKYQEDKVDDYYSDRKKLNSYIIFVPQKVEIDNENYYIGFHNIDFEKFMVNTKEWKSLNFEEYDYWDNTDKPDILTNYEWAERRRIWDEVLDDEINGNNIGVKIPIVDTNKTEFLYFRGRDKIIEQHGEYFNSNINEMKAIAIKEFSEKIKYNSCFNRVKEEFEKAEGIDFTKDNTSGNFMKLDRLIRNVIKDNTFTEDEIKLQEYRINEFKLLGEKVSIENMFLTQEDVEKEYKDSKNNKPVKFTK